MALSSNLIDIRLRLWSLLWRVRPDSDLDRPKLTKVRLLIQTSSLISHSTAVPNTVAGKLINIVSAFSNIYLIIIYALSSAHEKFGV